MISVIIPMYNSAGTIQQVLESVLKQTRLDLIREIIVVDDGSTDTSAEIVKKMALTNHKIKLIQKKNGGASSARNTGMKIATGQYIAFLDSDDLWMENKIERQMEVLEKNPEIVFLGCNHEERPLRIGLKKITELYNANVKELCIKSFPVTPSVIFKREIIQKIGYFDETQRYAEDINYFQKIATNYNYYFLPEKLVEIGFQKKYFAESGLTSNLKGMQQGSLKNIRELKNEKVISVPFYMLLRVFYSLKYVIRIVRREIRKIYNNNN